MKNVYYSLIYSQIIYAIEVWGSAVKSEMIKILILQKRVMRLMTFNDVFPSILGPLRPTDSIFVTLCCMKVEDIYKYQVAKFVFKCIHTITPVQFHNWYKLNNQIHEHYTRSNYNVNDGIIINNLFVPSARTTNYGLKQLKVSGTRIWNELPSYLKMHLIHISKTSESILYIKLQIIIPTICSCLYFHTIPFSLSIFFSFL